MAEATTSSTSSSSPSAPLSANAPQSKQYIKASTDDNALEPDALRGSEHVLKDLQIQDDEADRRKAITPEEKK
jgi:hypothetical protein